MLENIYNLRNNFIHINIKPKLPTKIKDLQEIGFVIFATNINPITLASELINNHNLLSSQWKLAQKPSITPQKTYLHFDNGVHILIEKNKIFLGEKINNNQPLVPVITHNYINNNLHNKYLQFRFCPKRVVSLPGDHTIVKTFFCNNLFNSTFVSNIDNNMIQTGIKFRYELEACQLFVTLKEVSINENKKIMPAILFSGSFNYQISESKQPDKLELLRKSIDDWENNVQIFNTMINQQFLG